MASDRRRALRAKPANPIQVAITTWFGQLPLEALELVNVRLEDLLSKAPKRWIVYPPMVLLPSKSFDEEWWSPITKPQQQRDALWSLMLDQISKREGKGTLTHLAINSGIPLHQAANQDNSENILRTPSGLIMLRGDFGPRLSPDHAPIEADFEAAFWVSTKQNGITQTWAPRYTMFSRGNIKEKARLLDFHAGGEQIGSRMMEKDEIKEATAVDLYAGIGYFVFSYIRMGMKRVLGWELNPWSVEGLRRGAIANGWPVRVVKSEEKAELGDEKIVVFLEDNRKAEGRRADLDLERLTHVNCGLLPSSEDSWKTALDFLRDEGWLHLHENVGVNDIDARRSAIEAKFQKWLDEVGTQRRAEAEHVELVKTFAPGVWHCVFDVHLTYY